MILSGTVNAGLGFNAATVPLTGAVLPPRPRFERWPVWLCEMVRLRESSDSIFLRIACHLKAVSTIGTGEIE